MKTISNRNIGKLWISLVLMLTMIASCAPKPASASPSAIEVKPVNEILPGSPGPIERTLEDTNSSLKASENRAVTGDNFLGGIYERPFTRKAMIYQPDVDILTASVANDANFFYFRIKLDGVDPKTKNLTADYAIEFDLNKDGRGDYIIRVKDPSKEWSSAVVTLFSDPDGDVGGIVPISAEAGFKGDGYEKIMDTSAKDTSFTRLSPEDAAVVEIAVSRTLLGDPKEFLWGAWADAGLRDPQKFDYNDSFGPTEAGSPIKGDADYPLKALFSVDNTCRVPYGFSPSTVIPGMCTSVQAKPDRPTPQPNRNNPAGAFG
jgi:hypothetical protein